jgi:phosphoribosylformimino-5-aminoimidazole carboxamide ribotide isomerase
MLILPAIDLRGGMCVRLRQGDYAQETVYHADPVAVAQRFRDAGARWLHLVDLGGAKGGRLANLRSIKEVVAGIPGISVEVGGGIRTTRAIEQLFDLGVTRVIIRTAAERNPGWFGEVVRAHPDRIALGLDARSVEVGYSSGYESGSPQGAMAASTFTHGWKVKSQRTVSDLLRDFGQLPLAAIIYTDIARDGMMSGPNLEATAEVVRATRLKVFASGGVTTVQDVERLKAAGVAGAIIGRALYEGTITLEAALAAAR